MNWILPVFGNAMTDLFLEKFSLEKLANIALEELAEVPTGKK